MSPEQTLSRREGLELEAFYCWLSPLKRLAPPYLGLVSIPVWLGAKHDPADRKIYVKKSVASAEKSLYILEFTLDRLRRQLNRVSPKAGRSSIWSGYMTGEGSYTKAQFVEKEQFVKEAVEEFRPGRVLDVGCNTGHFSALAARAGASVVALDADPVVVGHTWNFARAEKLDILPLVINLARPTPSTGWRNTERTSFLSRAALAFDAVIMLAVIHHMLATERIPLPEIIKLAAELTKDLLIVEFVCPDDLMFQRISRGRDELYSYLNTGLFEQVCQSRFEIVRSRTLSGSKRTVYLLRKKRS